MVLNKKKILLFTDWYEPGYKAGGPIQSCKNIVDLLKCDVDFFIVTSDRDLGDATAYKGIQTDEWIKKDGVNIYYNSPGRPTAKSIRELLHEINPDVVYLNSMFSFRYTLVPLWAIRKSGFRGKVVLAPRGMLQAGALKTKKLKKRIFLWLFPFSGIEKKIFFHATDSQETKDIRRFFRRPAGITLVPNVPNFDNSGWLARRKDSALLKVVFISRIHPKKNLEYALHVLGQMRAECCVLFNIYGFTDDPGYFEKCRSIASKLDKNVTVDFKGPLHPDETFSVLRDHHLFFLPTKGENFGHAIFEALASGCPVLISDQTPWEKLAAANAGWSVSLSEPHEFRKRIEEMYLLDNVSMNEKSRAAYEYAKNYVSSANLKDGYSKLFGLEINEPGDAHPRA
jgi:glycosyltransferase involved in cell wall biosynthesis